MCFHSKSGKIGLTGLICGALPGVVLVQPPSVNRKLHPENRL